MSATIIVLGATGDLTARYLLPMFGVPRQLAEVQLTLASFTDQVRQEIVGPLRLALNPLLEPINQVGELVNEFIKELVLEKHPLAASR